MTIPTNTRRALLSLLYRGEVTDEEVKKTISDLMSLRSTEAIESEYKTMLQKRNTHYACWKLQQCGQCYLYNEKPTKENTIL